MPVFLDPATYRTTLSHSPDNLELQWLTIANRCFQKPICLQKHSHLLKHPPHLNYPYKRHDKNKWLWKMHEVPTYLQMVRFHRVIELILDWLIFMLLLINFCHCHMRSQYPLSSLCKLLTWFCIFMAPRALLCIVIQANMESIMRNRELTETRMMQVCQLRFFEQLLIFNLGRTS